MGILKYGTRGYAPAKTQAFQEGGTVAVSKAYDWRDDPMSLCYYNKGCTTTAGFARQVEKRHLHLPGIKNRYFFRLEGGLPVTNDAINSITAKSQEDYYNKVRSSEEGWASTNEGQISKDC
jgi:hypothetical protein